MASIHSAANRLIRIPMDSEDIEKETRAIEHIASLNSIDLDVRKYIRRKFLRFQLSDTLSSPRQLDDFRKKWIRLLYLGQFFDLLAKELSVWLLCGLLPCFYASEPIIFERSYSTIHETGSVQILVP